MKTFALIIILQPFGFYIGKAQEKYLANEVLESIGPRVEEFRKPLFATLPHSEADIEKAINYQFPGGDRASVLSTVENDVRLIIISKAYVQVILELTDLYYLTYKKFLHTPFPYDSYIREVIDNKTGKFAHVEDFFSLTQRQLAEFNSETGRTDRLSLYLMTLSFIMCHETAHHVLGHTKETTGATTYEMETSADDWALKSASIPGVVAIGGVIALLYPMTLDGESFDIVVDKDSHPRSTFRILKFINRLIVDFNALFEIANKGSKVPLDHDAMIEDVRKTSLRLLSDFFRENPFPKEYLLDLAANNNSDAMMIIGYNHWKGIGNWARNVEESKRWLSKASGIGNNYADFILGLIYEIEDADPGRAAQAYRKSVQNGNGFARLHLDYFEKNKIRTENWKKMPKEIERARSLCMTSCVESFRFPEQDCNENHCKNHLVNIDSWIQSCRTKVNGGR